MDPSRIGSYIIEKKIGAGGMGTVYLGKHDQTGQEAAVKVLTASFSQEEGAIARFSREIDALKQIASPYIVKLFESGVDENETYYYAMEYVEGDTLSSRLRKDNRIGWRDVIEISVQICSALKAAHDAGFVHRDLKPSNLIFSGDGTVKLTDFGVAQVFASSRLTVTGGIIGTAEYMSPEQASGQRVTKKSDLYSLGAVMYVMLTGRPPFIGKTTLDIIQKHKFAGFDHPSLIASDMPYWLDEIVCQLLEKDPDKRIPDAYVLSRRLQEVLKKVELSMQEQTIGSKNYSALAATVAANQRSDEPGVATVMRDMMKAEVKNAHRPSAIGALFNNTWVLIGMLLLLIVGGFVWFSSGDLSAEERFEKGAALMSQPEGPDWITARDDFFEPLLNSDPDHRKKQVELYLLQIERYEFRRSLKNQTRKRLRRDSPPKGEIERILHLASYHRDAGDVFRASRMLSALGTLIENDPKHRELYQLSKTMLEELRSEQATNPQRDSLLTTAMDRADNLAEEGKITEARKIWESVLELYGDDPGAEELVDRARDALNTSRQ
ncbi:MAG: serine/threonine protein kinase [Planctomycetes bacterium]|nr:serine/threonine protein kinase [Planctomycetota bacterium]